METGGVKWTDVAQLVVSLTGFALVYWQVRELRQAVAGDTYASLYGQYVDVGKLFLDRPHLRPYFYDGKAVDDKVTGGERTREEVEILCELMAGLLEHAALQRGNLPKKIWEECWQAFTRERFKTSPALREFWEKNNGWYASEFQVVVKDCLNRIEQIHAPGAAKPK